MNSKTFVDDQVPKRVFELNGTKYLKNRKFYNNIPEFTQDEQDKSDIVVIPRIKIDSNNDNENSGSDDNDDDDDDDTNDKYAIGNRKNESLLRSRSASHEINSEIEKVLRNRISAEQDYKAKYQNGKKNPVYKSDVESNDEESNTYHDPASKFPSYLNHPDEANTNGNHKNAEEYATINDNDYHYLNPKNIPEINNKIQAPYEPSLTPIQLRIQQLKKDIFEEFITVRIHSDEIMRNVAVVSVFDRLWYYGSVAGINITGSTTSDLNISLQIGDLIESINETRLTTMKELSLVMEMLNVKAINFKIKRLPFARIIFMPKYQVDEASIKLMQQKKFSKYVKTELGIKLDSNKPARITNISQDGVVYRMGLKYNPNRVEYDIISMNMNDGPKTNRNRLTTWSLTEINGRPVSLIMPSDKIYELLCQLNGNDGYFVCQPTDLMKMLLKELKKKYGYWKNYTTP